MVKKLINTATNRIIDAAKTASKKLCKKAAEATGDLIENETAEWWLTSAMTIK